MSYLSVCLSVRPFMCLSVRRSTCSNSAPVDEFSWNMILEYFSKICRENSSLFTICQELQAVYMKTDVHLWHYSLSLFFLQWNIFQSKVVETIKTHISFFRNFFFQKSCHLRNNVEKHGTFGQSQMTTWRTRIACWLTKTTDTHSEYVIRIAFPRQILSASASILRSYVREFWLYLCLFVWGGSKNINSPNQSVWNFVIYNCTQLCP